MNPANCVYLFKGIRDPRICGEEDGKRKKGNNVRLDTGNEEQNVNFDNGKNVKSVKLDTGNEDHNVNFENGKNVPAAPLKLL